MLKNYLTTALRMLRRRKGYAALNVVGLAIGLACCLLIALYVHDELSFERSHEHAAQIVRVVENQRLEDRVSRLASSHAPVAAMLREHLAGVEYAVRVFPSSHLVRRDPTRQYQEDRFFYVDSTFLDVFTFPLLVGDAATALDDPFSLVLTASTARKYFGAANPVGRALSVTDDSDSYDFTVTGVVADPPANTHLQFDLLASYGSLRTTSPWMSNDEHTWDWPPMYVYARLAPGTDRGRLEAQLPALAEARLGEARAERRSFRLQPLTDIRLRSGRENELTPGGDLATVRLFALLAGFILLIACINFVNLATARAMDRAREVGVRKAIGARRGQLVHQFLGESTVLVALAFVLAVALVQVLLPVFNALSGKALTIAVLIDGPGPLVLLGMVGLVGLLAGGYPALYLSRFRPVRALKGAVLPSGSVARFREGLVVFQFAVTIILVIGTAVIHQQLDYVRSQRLGFDKEHVAVVRLRDMEDQQNHEVLKRAWQQLPGVVSVAASSGMPGRPEGLHDFLVKPERARQDSLEMMTLTVDADFAETFGLEVLGGRDLSEAFATDATEAFLLNESAARKLGWTDPVGERLTLYYWLDRRYAKEGTVVGVVRDFQVSSLHRAIDPTILHILPATYYYDYLSVRLEPGAAATALAALERTWARFNPERPFEATFLDAQFDALYRAEERLGRLVGAFSLLAVFIACLGLLGLAAYAAERRTKEIGVRKVLGASVGSIVALLSKDFVALVLIGFVVAVPVAWLAAERWLEGFAYRIDLGPGVFVLTGIAALLIALVTVSTHAVRAATTDPVKSLRYE